MWRKQSSPSFALMSTTSHGSGKLLPAILIPRRARTQLRPPSQATSHCARARAISPQGFEFGARLAVSHGPARGVLDCDARVVLREADDVAAAQRRHVRMAFQQLLHLGFEIGLIEEIADRPAIGLVHPPKLARAPIRLPAPIGPACRRACRLRAPPRRPPPERPACIRRRYRRRGRCRRTAARARAPARASP